MAKIKKLEELFHDTLKDVYFAEKKILTNLPKMAKAAQHADLKAAFEKAAEEIAIREKEEGKTASNPQAYFGRALVEHLKKVH